MEGDGGSPVAEQPHEHTHAAPEETHAAADEQQPDTVNHSEAADQYDAAGPAVQEAGSADASVTDEAAQAAQTAEPDAAAFQFPPPPALPPGLGPEEVAFDQQQQQNGESHREGSAEPTKRRRRGWGPPAADTPAALGAGEAGTTPTPGLAVEGGTAAGEDGDADAEERKKKRRSRCGDAVPCRARAGLGFVP